MIAEVAIICLTTLIGLGMTLYYLKQSKPPQKPLNQIELDSIRGEIRKLESRINHSAIGKLMK
jgi:predicted DNA-binding transcriptional regulator